MKQYDPNRVWERVQNAPVPDTQSLESLMGILAWEVQVLQYLSGKLPTPRAAETRTLSRQFQQQLACLKGMQVLISGTAPTIRPEAVPRDPPDLLLRQCYAQTLRLRAEYEGRRSDPAYGHIFRVLANDLPEQSRNLLALLGTLTK